MAESRTRSKHLSFGDVCGLLLCWAGVSTVAYLMKDAVVAVICLAAGYYLSKWIILKQAD